MNYRQRKQRAKQIASMILSEFPESKLGDLNSDQNHLLITGSRPWKWSSETCFEALRCLFQCGKANYQRLLHENGHPYPSLSTLYSRLKLFRCSPGVQYQSIQQLKSRLTEVNDHLHDVVLLLDEMSIKPKLKFCSQTKQIMGIPTISSTKSETRATHLYVVLLRGLTSDFKCVIGWHFTGNRPRKSAIKSFLTECISVVNKNNFRVRAVTADMGSLNRGIFKKFGIQSTRVNNYRASSSSRIVNDGTVKVINSATHESNPFQPIFFFHDIPHLYKSFRNMLLKYDFYIPDQILKSLNLCGASNIVSFRWIRQFALRQANSRYKMAFRLTNAHLWPDNYQKMRVNLARDVLSSEVSAGMISMIEEGLLPADALTTAHFIGLIDEWYRITNNRSSSQAFYGDNTHSSITEKSLEKINNFIRIISSSLFVNGKIQKKWFPVQSGIVLSSRSIIDISRKLLEEGKLFILTARFNQDALESFFGAVRSHSGINADASSVFRVLKMVICLEHVSSKSCSTIRDYDKCQFSQGYRTRPLFDQNTSVTDARPYVRRSATLVTNSNDQYNSIELQALYYIAGSAAHHLLTAGRLNSRRSTEQKIFCATCKAELDPREWVQVDEDTVELQKAALIDLGSTTKFTIKKDRGPLFRVSPAVFSFTVSAEMGVRRLLPKMIHNANIKVEITKELLTDNANSLPPLPTCCGLPELLLRRLVLLFIQRNLSLS